MPSAAFWMGDSGTAISYEWPKPDREYQSDAGAVVIGDNVHEQEVESLRFTTSNSTVLNVRCLADEASE
jgi:hypothetical protein